MGQAELPLFAGCGVSFRRRYGRSALDIWAKFRAEAGKIFEDHAAEEHIPGSEFGRTAEHLRN
jgi:hypothetical protein